MIKFIIVAYYILFVLNIFEINLKKNKNEDNGNFVVFFLFNKIFYLSSLY